MRFVLVESWTTSHERSEKGGMFMEMKFKMPHIIVSDKLYAYLLGEKKKHFEKTGEKKQNGDLLDMIIFKK